MGELSELIERVERATGADREIDAALTQIFGEVGPNGVPSCAGYLGIASFTSSVDSALALIERVRPGACVLIATTPLKTTVNIHDTPLGGVGTWYPMAQAPTPALALCLALLRAMEME